MKLAISTTFSPEKILLRWSSFPELLVRRPLSPTSRCAFLEEGGGAFLLAPAAGANAGRSRLPAQDFAFAGFQPLVRRLREFHGDRSVSSAVHLASGRLGPARPGCCRNHFADKANAIGFLRGNRLVQRISLHARPRSPGAATLRSAAAWQQAQLHFRSPELAASR